MRLERLEISGFKSFSDRAELAFDEGVTAIVGPNGCGKSNVADAITWVLGEQSAKSLRGDKMEDVIFSGSDARKPGGAAEVRLRLSGLPLPPKPVSDSPAHAAAIEPFRLDAPESVPGHDGNGHTNGHANGHTNGHGELDGSGLSERPVLASPTLGVEALEEFARIFTRDVEVTRRLYRSGDSEYLIDGEVVRLRDVHELLMDTGLGAKAYSIIEQGKIGMILSTRPADRRQLIEEAAGITKYKSRRRAAELKLEAAQQNLTRIDDIVFEVEKQRGTLKRQAAKARRYKRLRDELRRWEKVLFARRYRELAASIEGARARLADAREREAASAARLAELESDLARLRIELAEADQRASSLREDAHARELDVTARQHQQEFSRQQAEGLAARATEIEEEIRDLEARREPARLALESRRAAAAAAERDRDEAAARLAAATQQHAEAQRGIEVLDFDVDAARSDVYAHVNTATALRHAIQHAADQIDRVGITLSKLDVERDDLRRESETLEADRAQAAGQAAQTREALARVADARRALEVELTTMRGDYDSRVRAIRAREQEAAAAEARLASLQELASNHADFGDAARAVLAQADASVSPRGAVADYLDVDRRYERAVEACLGDLLQYILVDGHEQAAAGLSLVRAGAAGRCGFVVAGGCGGRCERPGVVACAGRHRGHRRGPDLGSLRGRAPLGPGRVLRGRNLRAGGCLRARQRRAGGHARGRRAARRPPGVGRRACRGTRHSRHPARDQGARRAHPDRARAAGACRGRGRAARGVDCSGGRPARRAAGRAARVREGARRRRGADRTHGRRGGAAGAQGRRHRARAAASRGRA